MVVKSLLATANKKENKKKIKSVALEKKLNKVKV